MDRTEMINSLAEAMGLKSNVKADKEFSKKYNTSTGTIYCNRTTGDNSAVAVFPVKRLAM